MTFDEKIQYLNALERPAIAVAGAGAVGGFYGALLQKKGFEVEFFTRSQADYLSDHDLNIRSVWGDFNVKINAFSSTRRMKKADIILVCCKALPHMDYKEMLEPLVRENSIIAVMQNGINNEEKIASLFKQAVLVSISAFTCINRENKGVIRHIDYGDLQFAPVLAAPKDPKNPENELSRTAAEKCAWLFENTGPMLKKAANHRALRWTKLMWNIPFNTLSVLLGKADTRQLTGSEHALNVVRALLEEAMAVAKAEGVELDAGLPDQMIQNTLLMEPYKTSMLLDYESHKEMEVEAILGEPLNTARAYNVHTPVLSTVYNMMMFYNSRKV